MKWGSQAMNVTQNNCTPEYTEHREHRTQNNCTPEYARCAPLRVVELPVFRTQNTEDRTTAAQSTQNTEHRTQNTEQLHPRVCQSCLFSPGRVGVGSPRCDGRQQMGEIGNQEQTIGDSRDDCRRTIRKPFTLKKPTSGDISEWCECVRVKSAVPRVQSRSH